MKHFALVIGSVALLLAACGNSDSPTDAMVGDWVWDEDEMHGTMYLSFLDDGRYMWGAYRGFDDGFMEGVYEVSGDRITLHENSYVMLRRHDRQESNLLVSDGEFPSWVEPGRHYRGDPMHPEPRVIRFAHEGDNLILTFVEDEDFPMRHRRVE